MKNPLKSHNIVFRVVAFLMIFVILAAGSIGLTYQKAYAVVGVDDAVIALLVAFLCGCGMTFTSASIANSTAGDFYNKCSPASRSIIDDKVNNYELMHAVSNPLNYVDVTWWGNELSILVNDFNTIFSKADPISLGTYNSISNLCGDFCTFDKIKNLYETTYSNLDVSVSMTQGDLINMQLSSNIDIYLFSADSFKARFGNDLFNIMLEHRIADSTSSLTFERLAGYDVEGILMYTIPGTCLSFVAPFSSLAGSLSIGYNSGSPTITFPGNAATDLFSLGLWIFNDDLCNCIVNWSNEVNSYLLTVTSPSYGNVVCDSDGSIFGSDVAMGKSICPDGLSLRADRLVRWLLGDDVISQTASVPKTPSISDVYNPANDNYWKDVIANPSAEYPWTIPMDTSKTITTSVPKIRNKNTVEPELGSDDSNSSPKIPKVPLPTDLTIPEVIFMRKFPFCLPYDLYNVLAQFFKEDTEAPVFTFPFKYERLGINYTFRLDFAQFQDVIYLNKTFINICFVVFLIIVSRKMIGAQ